MGLIGVLFWGVRVVTGSCRGLVFLEVRGVAVGGLGTCEAGSGSSRTEGRSFILSAIALLDVSSPLAGDGDVRYREKVSKQTRSEVDNSNHRAKYLLKSG